MCKIRIFFYDDIEVFVRLTIEVNKTIISFGGSTVRYFFFLIDEKEILEEKKKKIAIKPKVW